MKNKNKILLGALVVLLGVVIALWPKQEPRSESQQTTGSASQPTKVVSNQPRIPPVEQQLLPATPFGGADPARKFAKMGVLERGAILDKIEKLELPQIFQAMLDAEWVEHDSRKQMHLQTTFSNALQVKKPSPEFLEEMYGFIINRANSEFERHLLIGALQGAGTKESVDLLLRVANTAPEEKMRDSAATLAGVGSNSLIDPGLSPLLERTWRETGNPTLLRSTASSMAKIGAPSGIELLLSAALASDDRDKARKEAASSALQNTYKNNAVPPLAARLANQPPTSEAVQLVAPILARIGDETAGKALVDWLQGRNENAAALIDDLIRQRWLTNPIESGWGTALDPAVPFKNEDNRKAIREALDAYRAGRTSR